MATAKPDPVLSWATGRAPLYGSDLFLIALRIAVACWVASVALQVAMYSRPAPHGGVFLTEWGRYFWLAIYYEVLGIWLISLPFFLMWLLFYRWQLKSWFWRRTVAFHAILLVAYLALSQLDHEILRYLGVRLNPSFLYAYGQPKMLADPLFHQVLASDRGGPYVSLALLLAIPGLFSWWTYKAIRDGLLQRNAPFFWLAVAFAVIPLAAPANGWFQATSQFRLRKVEPVILAFATDFASGFAEWSRPNDFRALASEYQRRWLARNADQGWRFPNPEHPYLRVPNATQRDRSTERWNVIYLQLETLRGMEMGALNPRVSGSATPFLDDLASAPNSAVWTRAVSFGMPSINGLFAGHCSVAPSSRRYITGYTNTSLLCLPELLGQQGYRTEMFNGGDTDWDNSSPWLHRWYQRLWRFPHATGRDRIVFRTAASHLRRIGRTNTEPFFVTIVSASNHTPFLSLEPQLDIAGHATPAARIRNTTHYTDDVVREFVEAIRNEPWFARTLIVVTGDHGFNVGEHGLAPGQQDLYRESVWVPLIIAGLHPGIPAGRHDTPASLLDIPPTIADLLGIRVANPWTGHSLLAVKDGGGLAFTVRDSSLWESAAWSAVREPSAGNLRLYSRKTDWLQQHDQAAAFPHLAQNLIGRAERARRLNDYLLRHDLVWPGADPTERKR